MWRLFTRAKQEKAMIYALLLVAGACSLLFASMVGAGFAVKLGILKLEPQPLNVQGLGFAVRTLFAGLATIGAGLALVMTLTQMRIKRLEKSHDWLIDAVNWNVERLKAHGLAKLPTPGETRAPNSDDDLLWPWGHHHTELLGHLDAAAKKFWTLYDPEDPGTAPTNDMVADWLQKERDVSKDKSRAIASILRPDGLPTGPRR